MDRTPNRVTTWATFALAVAAVAVFAAVLNRGTPATAPNAAAAPNAYVGRPAPEFTLPDLDGKPVSLSSLKGRVVVLDLWATWCPPCVEELPAITAVAKRYADRGVAFHAINLGESADKVRQFLNQLKLDTPVLLDATGGVAERYGAQYIPLLVVIDATGRIVAHDNVAPADVDKTLSRWIESALKSGQAA